MSPLPLVLGPTPLVPLTRLSSALGAEIWCKRDDLTGLGLSGNKVRKLTYLLADAVAQGCTAVITTGGAQSNHARATAVAARQLGLSPHLLLRGPAPKDLDGNLLLDRLLGAEVQWCTAEAYRTERGTLMAQIADRIADQGGKAYVIPEGGSNALGARGFVDAAAEVAEQTSERFDGVVLAVGSGGTLAGLAMGPHLGPLYGIAVCDDAPTFEAIVHRIGDNAQTTYGLPSPRGRYQIVEGYQGPGYSLAGPEVWQTIAWVAQLEGLFLDPAYTGKAMHALATEIRAGRWGGRWLFWHTGGAFGLFGRGHEVPA